MADATCSFDGCDRPSTARTLCNAHYRQLMTRGWLAPIRVRKTTCAVEGCTNTGRITHGWCSAHYSRWKIYGDPRVHVPVRALYFEADERFWGRVDRRDVKECWPWTGTTTPKGYGQLTVGSGRAKRTHAAHRMSWELHFGAIPDGLEVMHQCDNPPCVNPSHLQLGTHLDNMQDRDEKNRVQHGARHVCAKLAEGDIVAICKRLALGETQQSIADSFGVNQSQISRIRSGKTWKRAPRAEARRGR